MATVGWVTERQTAVHLLRSGMAPSEVAAEMGHAVSWVCKYRDRYAVEGWEGIAEHSRAPHEPGNTYDKVVVKRVRPAARDCGILGPTPFGASCRRNTSKDSM